MSKVPTLHYLSEFDSLLQDYHLSDEAARTLAQTPFVLMAAASSAGRNTIIKQLLKSGNYYFIVSDTTRPPRENDGVVERDGVEYFFKAEEDILNQLKNGEMVETAVIHRQQVSGVSIREIKKAHDQSKIAITDIDPVGTDSIKKLKHDAICIFVLPPSFEEWQRRLLARGAMSAEERRRRLESARKEFETALQHDYYRFVVNDSLPDAIKAVDVIARFGTVDEAEQQQARELLKSLLEQTNLLLKQQ